MKGDDTKTEKKLWVQVYDSQTKKGHTSAHAAIAADKAVKEFRVRASSYKGTLWGSYREEGRRGRLDNP